MPSWTTFARGAPCTSRGACTSRSVVVVVVVVVIAAAAAAAAAVLRCRLTRVPPHRQVALVKCPTAIASAAESNLRHAATVALLGMPATFSSAQFFMAVAGLSYTGDPRMVVGENPLKVSNIVRANMARFSQLYAPVLEVSRGAPPAGTVVPAPRSLAASCVFLGRVWTPCAPRRGCASRRRKDTLYNSLKTRLVLRGQSLGNGCRLGCSMAWRSNLGSCTHTQGACVLTVRVHSAPVYPSPLTHDVLCLYVSLLCAVQLKPCGRTCRGPLTAKPGGCATRRSCQCCATVCGRSPQCSR